MSVTPSLRQIPLSYDNTSSNESALQLIFALRPEWKSSEDHIELKRFTDGITNTLLKATLKKPGVSATEADRDAVLLRAYGKGTGVLIDRDRECTSHAQLAQYQLAPPLLARFENGLLYSYLEGNACSPADLRRSEIWQAIATRLGQWHAIMPVPKPAANGVGNGCNGSFSHLPEPNLWSTLRKWIDALPVKSPEQRGRQELLSSELEFVLTEFGNTPGVRGHRLVFSHCDLLSGNVIIEPPAAISADASGQGKQGMPGTTRWGTYYSSHPDRPVSDPKPSKLSSSDENGVSVSFIDYEYATPAPAAFDIANHFAEWGGFDCDYSVLPTRSQRRDFLQHYLQSYRSQLVPHTETSQAHVNGNGTKLSADDVEVEQLFSEVDRYRGLPGFYWGIWALIQATISTIEFDYASYAEVRLNEYWAWKRSSTIDSSRKLQDSGVGLREQRWAEE